MKQAHAGQRKGFLGNRTARLELKWSAPDRLALAVPHYMNWKKVHRITAGVVFLYALVLYALTVSPTASFWDSGEFIAIAHGLQVSHPPGAPFFMLVGRLFSMFVPVEYISLAINLVSVIASAFTILLTYLIIVRLVREWQGSQHEWSFREGVMAVSGGVVGACTFAASDSFWFNAVEAEVYALSMLFTALVVWLIMRWSEMARREEEQLRGGHHPFGLSTNRILVLVAYLFGLAIGVHLLSLLAVFFIALIFFFTEYDRLEWTDPGVPDWRSGRRWMGVGVALVIATAAFLVVYPGIIQKLPDLAGGTGAPLVTMFIVVGLVAYGVYYTQRRRMHLANLGMLCLLMILIGYSTYALIFIRSVANPPIDENDPETPEAIVSYLAREQYGSTPLLRGPVFDDAARRLDDYDTKYLPRRHSPNPTHWRYYARYDSDWSYFWRYQVGHMYVRYFLWNFTGKESDLQDARAITGFSFMDGDYESYFQTPSERAGRNRYFALPLLLGLFGMMYHFSQDWRRALSVLMLFLVTGIGIILYLNQTPMQPRERDYSYVASFLAFSLWVGIGATGLLQLVLESVAAAREKLQGTILVAFGGVLFAAVPLWMTFENYADHDRSGRYIAPDYAYNMLISTEEDAILFTNGDNDTFPLWYVQEVEGVRRDVRVVNLSLLNTPWYIRQLKYQHSRESAPLPIGMDDDFIESIGISRWEPRTITLPVGTASNGVFSEVYTGTDDQERLESPMAWRLEGRIWGRDPSSGEEVRVLYAADIAALDILRTNADNGWDRPVYFAVTVSPDGMLDLSNFLQAEGQAQRVVPIRHNEPFGRVVPSITPDRVRQFRFRGLDDPDVYFDQNIRQMVDNYRNVFGHTAMKLTETGRPDQAAELMDYVMERIPFETVPGDEQSYLLVARAYQAAGKTDKIPPLLKRAEDMLVHRLEYGGPAGMQTASRVVDALFYSYLEAHNFEAASAFQNRLASVGGMGLREVTPEELRRTMDDAFHDDSATADTIGSAVTDTLLDDR